MYTCRYLWSHTTASNGMYLHTYIYECACIYLHAYIYIYVQVFVESLPQQRIVPTNEAEEALEKGRREVCIERDGRKRERERERERDRERMRDIVCVFFL